MGDSLDDNSVEVVETETNVKVDVSESLQPKLISDLSSICDINVSEAEALLKRHNWNMQVAVDSYLEDNPPGASIEVAEVLIDLDDRLKTTFISDLSSICDVAETEARQMLEKNKWNMQKSIDEFLGQESDDGEDNKVENMDDLDTPEIPTSKPDSATPGRSNNSDAAPGTTSSSGVDTAAILSPMGTSTWAPETFTILSWNLDGLDPKNLERRTTSVVDTIEKSPGCGYLTATFLRLQHIIYEDHSIVKYPNTSMERNVLVTKAFSGRAKLCLLNTHLESTAEFANERINQLTTCFKICRSIGPEYNVIFGGDLNLRDKEVVGRMPSNMCDLWEANGARGSCRYTWDLKRNTNKQMPSKFQPSCRFDRFYYRASDPVTLKHEFFGITGIEKVPGTQSFPSDHWAIISSFRLEQEARKPQPNRKRKAENSTP